MISYALSLLIKHFVCFVNVLVVMLFVLFEIVNTYFEQFLLIRLLHKRCDKMSFSLMLKSCRAGHADMMTRKLKLKSKDVAREHTS